MRPSDVRPTGVERTFGEDELIVSKTDLQGRITYANDVFLRVSAYPESGVLGQPHSMIRHPDMPRAIFRLLWESLGLEREIFAYVNNLAGDGAHYWVLAHVTPSLDRRGTVVGYHSSRRVPSRRALDTVKPLYRTLLGEERRHARPVDAVESSTVMLQRVLDELGMTYDQFVWSLTDEGVAA